MTVVPQMIAEVLRRDRSARPAGACSPSGRFFWLVEAAFAKEKAPLTPEEFE
jgi:hypothetical protein